MRGRACFCTETSSVPAGAPGSLVLGSLPAGASVPAPSAEWGAAWTSLSCPVLTVWSVLGDTHPWLSDVQLSLSLTVDSWPSFPFPHLNQTLKQDWESERDVCLENLRRELLEKHQLELENLQNQFQKELAEQRAELEKIFQAPSQAECESLK